MSTFDPDNEAFSESRKYAESLNNTYCDNYTPDHLIKGNYIFGHPNSGTLKKMDTNMSSF
jgi:hypothetical protein